MNYTRTKYTVDTELEVPEISIYAVVMTLTYSRGRTWKIMAAVQREIIFILLP
jgi:hypothetical protein